MIRFHNGTCVFLYEIHNTIKKIKKVSKILVFPSFQSKYTLLSYSLSKRFMRN